MNPLSYILARSKSSPTTPDPIALEPAQQARYESWESGFNAYEAGHPLEACDAYGRARPLWREGWHAAKRIDELIAEQAVTTRGEL